MTSHDNRRSVMGSPGHEFGPHLSHQDAMRRLTALSSGCKSCANDVQRRPADLDRARPQPMPKLRHYPMVQEGNHSPQQESVGGMPISPPAKSLASPPTSPLVSFWGAFFDTTNSTTSVFAQNQKLGMPFLSINDI
mmetsp:Transcript_91624/g.147918  ORF Transcript_91624/g.147918 Transcript_91624/m.147918 type:complete len:136 (-) Transcript_91624:93-500(-)|eukprot:CAMPEP_0173072440 /NCGR_PEP_ID=MMETSP1102-20130122/9819_1 /TAXON_ID=49646 /ORGANISM="Geminigera sp., Strain Caron Lab Isolate" /LENGTH=135 /DNA_ID=CAMNT_0013941111 /DNA_START=51 /DNA_END=458 /DNA_ORIENTATION=+